MAGQSMLSKLWKWTNEKPLGASLVAGLVLLAVPGFLAWMYSWELWLIVSRVSAGVFHWLIGPLSIKFPVVVWLILFAAIAFLVVLVVRSLIGPSPDNVESFLQSYTEDVFDGITWRWRWVKDYGGWSISGISPYCECEGPLIPSSSELAQDLAHARTHNNAGYSYNTENFVCTSMTCGRTFKTKLPLHAGFERVKSLVEEEVRTRYRRKIREAQELAGS